MTIVTGDLFEADLSDATVVAVYLPPEILERLAPKSWAQARVRIVSHQFRLPGGPPDASHAIHLYRVR